MKTIEPCPEWARNEISDRGKKLIAAHGEILVLKAQLETLKRNGSAHCETCMDQSCDRSKLT